MEIRELIEKIKDIEGFLFDKEGYLLYNIAKGCTGKGKIVEIGSWKGKSTVCLGYGSKDGRNVKVYAIDPHVGSPEHQADGLSVWTFDEFMKNIKSADVDDLVHPLIKNSEEAAREFNEPVELLFIDGAHEYDAVKNDFELWVPKVVNGGFVVMHDVSDEWEGPQRVAKDLMYKSGRFRHIRTVDSITCGVKVKRNSLIDRFLYSTYVFLDDVQKTMPKSFSKRFIKVIIRNVKRVINLL